MSWRHPISAAEQAKIVDALAGTVSFRDLAKAHDRSECTIRRIARAHGIFERRPYHIKKVSPGRKLANERRDLLAEHVAEGGTLTSFADANGLTDRGAQYIWKRIVLAMGVQAV